MGNPIFSASFEHPYPLHWWWYTASQWFEFNFNYFSFTEVVPILIHLCSSCKTDLVFWFALYWLPNCQSNFTLDVKLCSHGLQICAIHFSVPILLYSTKLGLPPVVLKYFLLKLTKIKLLFHSSTINPTHIVIVSPPSLPATSSAITPAVFQALNQWLDVGYPLNRWLQSLFSFYLLISFTVPFCSVGSSLCLSHITLSPTPAAM